MATFHLQVEALTSIDIDDSSTPTQDEISQFLVDGTKDVANKIIMINPEELSKFCSTTHDANNSGITVKGKVLSVVREHDSTSVLRPCMQISPNLRYEASNVDSLHYRSKYNPGFYILDGKIHTVPISATSDNDSVVTQVTYAVNTGHASSSIDNFPDEYEYLVVLYAAIKAIEALIASYTVDEEDIELVRSYANSLATLKQQYLSSFGVQAEAKIGASDEELNR